MYIFLARGRARHKSDILYGAFSTVMFLLVTFYVAILGVLGQERWLPGQKYTNELPPFGYIDATAVMPIILQQMTDGLMVRPRR